MSFYAIVTLILAVILCLVFYNMFHNILHPLVIFNALWAVVIAILLYNPMDWYLISDDIYIILLVGLASFNIGGFFFGYGTLRKDSVYYNNSIEEDFDEGISIDYENAASRLFKIQVVLTIICIPILLRAISYLGIYSFSEMRNVYADGVESGYMTAAERILYLHVGIFPLMQSCAVIQGFLWVRGEAKFRNLLISIVDIAIVFVVSVGRWEILYFAIALICAYVFNSDNWIKTAVSTQIQKRRKYVKWLVVVAVGVLVVITVLRHNVDDNVFSTVAIIFGEYFCCGPALLQVMVEHPVDAMLDVWHWGASFFNGFLSLLSYIIQIVTLRHFSLSVFNAQSYAVEFHKVGSSASMNAYTTWYYYFMQDFGMLGVIVFTAIIGAIAVRAYRKVKDNNSLTNQLLFYYIIRVVLFSSIWWELRRTDVVATMMHTIWLLPLIGISPCKNKRE